ncbi:MAG: TIGR03118 family protein [Harvfovirus sp.]|uniref:TIGR03118 family protein n=1 Tax=Harvfovirus sp. TaxID=2487768 RepID=A0A3G5A244_9VIRU|nr:MAG: TIGR03118 family protein [Harvfovirus sp.]
MCENSIYDKKILVVNDPFFGGKNVTVDPLLINPWGLAKVGDTLYVNDNASKVITLYTLQGAKLPTVLNLRPFSSTGLIANNTNNFKIGSPGIPSLIIFCGNEPLVNKSSIFAYNPLVNPLPETITLVKFHPTGLCIHQNYLFVCGPLGFNVFNSNFMTDAVTDELQNILQDSFVEPTIPPFNLVSICNKLYITYAGPNASLGNGYVDQVKIRFIQSTPYVQITRIINRGVLNRPWGITLSPNNLLLIGNQGDGLINQFTLDGCPLGPLKETKCLTSLTDGLWSLLTYQDKIFFTAGPTNNTNGVLGKLTLVAEDDSD